MDDHRLTSRTVWLVLGNVIAVVGLIYLVWVLRDVVALALVALLFALALETPVQWLIRRGFGRIVSVLIVIVLAFGVIAGIFASLVPMIVEQARALVDTAPQVLERLQDAPVVRWADRRFDVIAGVQEELRARSGEATQFAISAARSVLYAVVAAITIVFLTLFMLLFGGGVVGHALELVPPESRPRWRDVAVRIREVVGGYVLGALAVATVGGTVVGTTLWLLDVPYFLPLALMMIVLGLIPYLGGALGALLAVGVTFGYSGGRAAIVMLAVYVVYQQLENHVLQPLVQRKAISLNPLLVALALLAGAALAGVVGAVLALPVAGAIHIVLSDVQDRREERWRREGRVEPAPPPAPPPPAGPARPGAPVTAS